LSQSFFGPLGLSAGVQGAKIQKSLESYSLLGEKMKIKGE
jgi:hypothetical protein